METYELEEKIYNALTDDAELMSLLPRGAESIYHYVAPSNLPDKYPLLVYSTISDVPGIHVITAERNTVAEQEKFWQACAAVKRIMKSLLFVRRQTTLYREEGKAMLIFDYVKGEKS